MRIVSLCPSLTETLFALGRGNDLVGRTRYCNRPEGAVEAVPVMGGTKNPKIEAIVAARPDLVLLNEEENREEDARALAAAGLHCHTSLPRTPAETAAMVRSVGEAIERPGEAEVLAREIEARAAAASGSAAGRSPLRWAYLIWRKPWMAVGEGTYIDALLTLPGGINVFASMGERYPAVTAEDLAAAAPEAVFLSSEPFPFADKHIEELTAATGLPAEHFHLVDGQILSWHGASTPAGIDYAAALLGRRGPQQWLGSLQAQGKITGEIVSPATEEDEWDALRS
jgi:ABC-type Fe3+-hydroxamate transport system substrate-binding protein